MQGFPCPRISPTGKATAWHQRATARIIRRWHSPLESCVSVATCWDPSVNTYISISRCDRFWAQVDGWADLRLKGHLQRGGSCQLPRESEGRGNHIDLEEGGLDSQLPASLQACRMDSFGFLIGFWFTAGSCSEYMFKLQAEVVA